MVGASLGGSTALMTAGQRIAEGLDPLHVRRLHDPAAPLGVGGHRLADVVHDARRLVDVRPVRDRDVLVDPRPDAGPVGRDLDLAVGDRVAESQPRVVLVRKSRQHLQQSNGPVVVLIFQILLRQLCELRNLCAVGHDPHPVDIARFISGFIGARPGSDLGFQGIQELTRVITHCQIHRPDVGLDPTNQAGTPLGLFGTDPFVTDDAAVRSRS